MWRHWNSKVYPGHTSQDWWRVQQFLGTQADRLLSITGPEEEYSPEERTILFKDPCFCMCAGKKYGTNHWCSLFFTRTIVKIQSRYFFFTCISRRCSSWPICYLTLSSILRILLPSSASITKSCERVRHRKFLEVEPLASWTVIPPQSQRLCQCKVTGQL